MYKYLSIAPNVNEMMVMLTSLPVCTIVFDQNSKIIDINQPALDFLKVDSIDSYLLKKWIVLNDAIYLKKIIHELKTGKIVRDRMELIRCPDYRFKNINIFACMLTGVKKVFIFQFFELAVSLQKHMNYTVGTNLSRDVQIESCESDFDQMLTCQVSGAKLFQSFVNEDKAQLLSQYISLKYPDFSNNEIFICVLLALRKSTREIATVTKSNPSHISYVIYKLLKRFNVRLRRDLSIRLINECSEMKELK